MGFIKKRKSWGGGGKDSSCDFDFFDEFLLQVLFSRSLEEKKESSFDFGDLYEDWSVAGTLTCGPRYMLILG